MKWLTFLLLLLSIAFSGCAEEYEGNPYNGGWSLRWVIDYDGHALDDDKDLYTILEVPDDSASFVLFDRDGNPSTSENGGAHGCRKYDPEYQDKSWWLRVTLYTEEGGELVDRETWDIDCLQYWIHIDKEGQMDLHLGYPPGYNDSGLSRDEVFGGGLVVASVVVLGGLVFLGVRYYRKRKR